MPKRTRLSASARKAPYPVDDPTLGPDPDLSGSVRPFGGIYGPSLILPPAPVAAAELELERELFADLDGDE